MVFSNKVEGRFKTFYDSDPAAYKICNVIGDGRFASCVVYSGQYVRSHDKVALKKYDLETLSLDEIELIKSEVALMRQLSHPNILPLLALFTLDHYVICVFPLIEYKSCTDLIALNFPSGLPEKMIVVILSGVLQGLQYMHRLDIIHRAIKASHILIQSNSQVCLTGFRNAYWDQSCDYNKKSDCVLRVNHLPPSSTQNLAWLSPEILHQNLLSYNKKSDIYSLGITLCELANGVVPYKDISLTTMLLQKLKGLVPVIYDSKTVECEKGSNQSFCTFNTDYSTRTYSKQLHSFKNICCTLNQVDRPDATMLLKHPLLNKKKTCKTVFVDITLSSDIEKNDVTHSKYKTLQSFSLDMTRRKKSSKVTEKKECNWNFELYNPNKSSIL